MNNREQKVGGRSGGSGRTAERLKVWETGNKPLSHNPQSFYVSVYFILGDRHEYTVNKIIHNVKEVNIRQRDARGNKCRHQSGICINLCSLVHRTAGRAEHPVGRGALISRGRKSANFPAKIRNLSVKGRYIL